jgi:trimeric autotransporter adhesin
MNFKFKLSRRLARMKLAAIAATLALGCQLTSSGPFVDRIEGINVQPGRLSLLPFQSADLSLLITTSRGGTPDLGSLQWSVTGGTIANNGIIAGAVHMTYTSPAQAGTYLLIVTTVTDTPVDTAHFVVTLTPVPVNAVSVAPGTVSLAAGDTTTLHATLTDSTGAVLLGREITWSTSDASIATVLATGFVRAVAPGSATVTATAEGHSGSAVVTVKAGP